MELKEGNLGLTINPHALTFHFNLLLSTIVTNQTRLNSQIQDGEAGLQHILPDFPTFTKQTVPVGFTLEEIDQFMQLYRLQAYQFLELMQKLQFNHLEVLLRNFWSHLPDPFRLLVNTPETIECIWRWDSLMYDTILRDILPSPLQQLPIQVTQALRHCSRQLESWLLSAMEGYYPMLVARKVEMAKVFGQQLKRYTSLNFLAQGAALVLESAENMHLMFTEWSKLDFEGIKVQASWITECRKVEVMQIAEMEIKHLLSSSSKLQQWTTWLDGVILRFLDEKRDPARYIYQARQFITKWTFYGSLCMRDLTLRSMSTFGSFHIVRTFLDEYILYCIEQKLANLQNEATQNEKKV
ncbi:hypothetical protein HMI56_000228 [Coelomomyces lativittatus]|nr:hypothetical protein HMI56_000228 [Coelomomyces lativittatus]